MDGRRNSKVTTVLFWNVKNKNLTNLTDSDSILLPYTVNSYKVLQENKLKGHEVQSGISAGLHYSKTNMKVWENQPSLPLN